MSSQSHFISRKMDSINRRQTESQRQPFPSKGLQIQHALDIAWSKISKQKKKSSSIHVQPF